jgi:hypothetical protein
MSKQLMDVVLPRLARPLYQQLERYRTGQLNDKQFTAKFEALLRRQHAWLAKRGISAARAALAIHAAVLVLSLPGLRAEAEETKRCMPEFIYVDPGTLRLPPSRAQGADPGKLARQIARYGDSLDGMPPLQLIRGKDGHLRINDGVTRASRAAKLLPGVAVPAEVIQDLPGLDVTRMPTVKDVLP